MFSTLFLVLTGISGLFAISKATEPFKRHGMFFRQCRYQLATLALALVLLFLNRTIHNDYRSVLSFGNLEAPTKYLSWLGIPDGTKWSEATLTFLIFPLIFTSIVVYLQIIRNNKVKFGSILSVLPAAILLSVFNSFTEEIISMCGINIVSC